MKKRNRKIYDDDDGRVVSSMNVDGMPWYNEGLETKPDTDSTDRDEEQLELTREEKRAIASGVFAASALVAGIFILAGFLFVLFCKFVWLR